MSSLGSGTGLFTRFLVLRGALRELWVVFGTKLLTILAYGVMNSTLILWLSSDLGFGDVGAGNLVTTWSALMTLATVLVGSLVDSIGLRRAFLLGASICLVARGVMTFGHSTGLVIAFGLCPLALGEALLTPVMLAAVRRYSTTAQRSIAFSLFYVMMNLGFFIGSLIFDFVRQSLGEYGHVALPILGVQLSTYRVLFLISFVLTIPNLAMFLFFLREGIEAGDNGVVRNPVSLAGPLLSAFREAFVGAIRIFTGLWRQSAFYKFLILLSLVVAVRLIFFHMYYTYPKFGIRELGPGAPIGRLWAMNSLLIIILVPIFGALTQNLPAYRMVTLGTSISAASVFIMALPPELFAGLANGLAGKWIGNYWLGLTGSVHPYYVMIFVYVSLLSVGEALWSPRLYEYTAAIAPKGQEASYMSLSYLPFFVAKLFAGSLSGVLLATFCPETGPRNSQALWMVIALTTLITPVGLIVFRRFIQVQERGETSGSYLHK